MQAPKCFISYSWDSEEHKDWVRRLATKLQENGVTVRLDQWDVHPGMDLAKYMETSVRESDYVLLVCTPRFAEKANAGSGGVGYEKMIVTGEIFYGAPAEKFVPVLRTGSPEESFPSYLKSKVYIDFRNDNDLVRSLESLLRHLHESPKYVRPPIGPKPHLKSVEEGASNKQSLDARQGSMSGNAASHREKLEVTLQRTEYSKYSVFVSWRGMRESSRFAIPFSESELVSLTRLIGDCDKKTGRPKASDKELKDLGLKLYESLFPAEKIRDIVSKCLATDGDALDLELKYGDPEIGKLPWELLHDGRIPMVASGKLNLVRVPELHEAFRQISAKAPLKVLVVISRPLDQPHLEDIPPADKIRDELGSLIEKQKVVVHFLTPSTHDELVKWLGQGYDIVQFYGHGGFSNGKGCLVFENDLGLSYDLTADELAVALQGSKVQVTVLCACYSGVAPSEDLFTGVAQSLVGVGVPAVVGWGFAVPVETALAFMKQFYAVLATDREPSIRKAVAQARRVLYARGTAHFLSLFERTLDDRLIQTGTWDPATLIPLYKEPPHNLQEALGRYPLLVGRFRELAELSKALASREAVVALWGFWGVGKTALAVRGVYDRFMWRFPDGIWYVELRGGKTLDTILTELCAHLQVSVSDATEKKEQEVLQKLGKTKTLLLLDNFEDVEADPQIISFLNKVAGLTRVLLTTRSRPLRDTWRKLGLPRMRGEEAIQLFLDVAERAGANIATLDLEKISEICRRLDYFPIALTHVAASIGDTTLEDVLDRLEENPPDPVRAGFDYAYTRLSGNAKELIARLSIFRFFRLAEIEAISTPSDPQLQISNWRECKDELRRRDLLLFSLDLFSMLTMTRHLAAEHLKEPRKKWHSIAADHFLSQKTIDAFEAFDHLREAERWKDAVELINAAQKKLSEYGLGGELAPRLEEAAKIAADKLGDRALQSHSLGYLASILDGKGRYEESLLQHQKALRIQRDLLKSDPDNVEYLSDLSTTLNNLGNLLFRMGRWDDALGHYTEDLEASRKLLKSDPDNVERQSDVATTLNNLGNLIFRMGRWDYALKYFTEALDAYRKLLKSDPNNVGYQSNVATTLNNLGALLPEMGRRDDALKHYTEALEVYRKLLKSDPNNVGYQSNVATTLNNLGALLPEMGRRDDALKHYTEALDAYRKLLTDAPENLVYKERISRVRLNISILHEEANRLKEAVSSAQSLIDESKQMSHPRGEAEGYLRLGNLHVKNVNDTTPDEMMREVLRLAKENDLPDMGDRALVLKGRILLKAERNNESFACFSEACISSLEHGWETHSRVVNEVVQVLKLLREQGKKQTAEQLAGLLIQAWKDVGLDKQIPQFIELVQKET